jgi:glycosidase
VVNPSLYQIHTRVFLSTHGRAATLDDIPDSFLDQLAAKGFDWLWLLGVWAIGPTGRFISRSNTSWRKEYAQVLPDVTDADICGSPFALVGYHVDEALGGDEALVRIRKRIHKRGMKLMLDFVPNHVGQDHPWTVTRPEFFFEGTNTDLERDPARWVKAPSGRIFALGRDPNFPGWPDTLQLNYFNPALREAMVDELLAVASRCDGVRCDMAMLLEPEVFSRTWETQRQPSQGLSTSFWPDAIAAVRADHPAFLFLAEVYWGYEWKLLQHGFNYAYDKTLYDRLLSLKAADVHSHLIAPLSYQAQMARFLENHDEPTIASRLPIPVHKAAAALTYLAPGLRFFFDGQLEGRRARVPVHLARGPKEKPVPELVDFYKALLPIAQSLPCRAGSWNLLDPRPAWDGNQTNQNFLCYLIEHPLDHILLVVNYASYRGQCSVRLPHRGWLEGSVELRDRLTRERYRHSSAELQTKGLFVDLPEWGMHLFSLECL